MAVTTNGDLFWKCDDCGTKFTIGNGFLGSINDFEYQMKKDELGKEDLQELGECHPFMSFVQLCNICKITRFKKRNG